MKTSSTLSSLNSPEAARAHESTLAIAVAFDAASHLAEARKLLKRLLSKCEPGLTLHADEWAIADLQNARFRQEALELAHRCDMLVVACDEATDTIVSFITDWLPSPRDTSAALVILAFCTRCIGAFEFHGLRQLAHQHRVDCFSTVVEAGSPRQTVAAARIAVPAEDSPLND